MSTDIRQLFETLHTAVAMVAKRNGFDQAQTASMKAALAIGELVVTDIRRIADAAESVANAPQ
jgi:hypothetical protein